MFGTVGAVRVLSLECCAALLCVSLRCPRFAAGFNSHAVALDIGLRRLFLRLPPFPPHLVRGCFFWSRLCPYEGGRVFLLVQYARRLSPLSAAI